MNVKRIQESAAMIWYAKIPIAVLDVSKINAESFFLMVTSGHIRTLVNAAKWQKVGNQLFLLGIQNRFCNSVVTD